MRYSADSCLSASSALPWCRGCIGCFIGSTWTRNECLFGHDALEHCRNLEWPFGAHPFGYHRHRRAVLGHFVSSFAKDLTVDFSARLDGPCIGSAAEAHGASRHAW